MNVLLWAPDVSRLPVEAALRALPGLALTSVASTEDMAAALPQAEALVMPVSQYTPLLARQLHERASRLRWIQLMSIGFDRLVRDPPPAGVMVSNAGASLAPIVAEHTLALLLG